MRSGRWPPVGSAKGVTWPDQRYWRTKCVTAAAAMWATTCTKHVAVSVLFTTVVSMFRSHAEGSRFAESWNALERDRGKIGNLGPEDF